MADHRSLRAHVRALPVLGIVLLSAPLASGCELFVHFDRSRIGAGDTGDVDGGRADGGIDSGVDANVDGGGVDMGVVDMGAIDMGAVDMGVDDMGAADMGTVDTGTIDMGVDAFVPPVDMGVDAFVPVDMGVDAFVPPVDMGVDAGCGSPAECPATGNECIVATCTAGACGTMNLGMSHVMSTGQMPGDCQVIVCNGAGGTTSIGDPTDLPTSTTVCLINPACSGTPLTPSFDPAPTGTDCTSDGHPPAHVCGATTDPLVAGTCVQCNVDADCVAGGLTTCGVATHTCS